jgi:hypothetical protein
MANGELARVSQIELISIESRQELIEFRECLAAKLALLLADIQRVRIGVPDIPQESLVKPLNV